MIVTSRAEGAQLSFVPAWFSFRLPQPHNRLAVVGELNAGGFQKSARRSKLRGCDCHFPFLHRSLNPCTSSVYFNQENPCDEAGRREGDNRARNEPIKADPILARDHHDWANGKHRWAALGEQSEIE
jgi:hypothetical protein